MSQVTVYKYGVPLRQLPEGLPAEVGQQLWLAHQLREDLVTIEHDNDEAVQALYATVPTVAAVEARMHPLVEAEKTAAEAVQQAKIDQRTRSPKGQAVDELARLRGELKILRAERRAAVKQAHPQLRDQLRQLESAKRARIKSLYADYVQDTGLYWATYNDVVAHHRTAVQRVLQQRSQGKPAQLRHHRWDGTGTIAVQPQRDSKQPARAPELLASGSGPWRNVLQIRPWVPPEEFQGLSRSGRRHTARGHVGLTLGRKRWVWLPAMVHRMLPAEADVTGARLTVRRVGADRQAHLTVTARVPDPAPARTGPRIALHLGWRTLDAHGRLRVATWRADQPTAVPAHLAGIVDADTDRSGTITLPGQWRDQLARLDAQQATRDRLLDEIRAELADWLEQHGGDEDPTPADIRRWRAPGRFARLALDWRGQPDRDPIARELEKWRRADKHLWQATAHGRDKILARRDNTWRLTAAWLATTAGQILLDDTDLATLARRVGSDVPDQQADAASRQRVDAAPGELRNRIRTAADRDGIPITTVPHTGASRRHTCGHLNPADERYAKSVIVTCDGCRRDYDQDRSAAVNMLASAPADS